MRSWVRVSDFKTSPLGEVFSLSVLLSPFTFGLTTYNPGNFTKH